MERKYLKQIVVDDAAQLHKVCEMFYSGSDLNDSGYIGSIALNKAKALVASLEIALLDDKAFNSVIREKSNPISSTEDSPSLMATDSSESDSSSAEDVYKVYSEDTTALDVDPEIELKLEEVPDTEFEVKSDRELLEVEAKPIEEREEPATPPNIKRPSVATGISINDRFLYMRELFNGNVDLYNRTIMAIDESNDREESMSIFLESAYLKEGDSFESFQELISRKFK